MVFDAHARAFAFFGGVPPRGIYDNMKTAVDAVFAGKERLFNRRFLMMCRPLHDRADRLHAGVGLGEGPGREPGRAMRETVLQAPAPVRQPGGAERLAGVGVRAPVRADRARIPSRARPDGLGRFERERPAC